MRFEIKKIRKFIRNIQVQKNIININNNNKESKSLYNKIFFSKKTEQKRKRKTYKLQLEQSTFFEFQNQFELKFFFKSKFFLKSFQILLKVINVKQQNVQIIQISIAKLIIRFRVIRYLYENHLNVEFSHTVRDIYEIVINHFIKNLKNA